MAIGDEEVVKVRTHPWQAIYEQLGMPIPDDASTRFGISGFGLDAPRSQVKVKKAKDLNLPQDTVQTKPTERDVAKSAIVGQEEMKSRLLNAAATTTVVRGETRVNSARFLHTSGPRVKEVRTLGRSYVKKVLVKPKYSANSAEVHTANGIIRGANSEAKKAGNYWAIYTALRGSYVDGLIRCDMTSYGTRLDAWRIALAEGIVFRNGVLDPNGELQDFLEQVYEGDAFTPTVRVNFFIPPEFPPDLLGLLAYSLLPSKYLSAGHELNTEAYVLQQPITCGLSKLRFVLPTGYPAQTVSIGGQEVTDDKLGRILDFIYSGELRWMRPVVNTMATELNYRVSYELTSDRDRPGHTAHNQRADGGETPYYIKPTRRRWVGQQGGADVRFQPGNPYNPNAAAEQAKAAGGFPRPWAIGAFLKMSQGMPDGAAAANAGFLPFESAKKSDHGISGQCNEGAYWLGRASELLAGVRREFRVVNDVAWQAGPAADRVHLTDLAGNPFDCDPDQVVVMLRQSALGGNVVQGLTQFLRGAIFTGWAAGYYCRPSSSWGDAVQAAVAEPVAEAWHAPVNMFGGLAAPTEEDGKEEQILEVPLLDIPSVAALVARAVSYRQDVEPRQRDGGPVHFVARTLFKMTSWSAHTAMFAAGLDPATFSRVSQSTAEIVAGIDPGLSLVVTRPPYSLNGINYAGATTQLFTYGDFRCNKDKPFKGTDVKQSYVNDDAMTITANLSVVDSAFVDASARSNMSDSVVVALDRPSGRRWSVVWECGSRSKALPIPICLPRVVVRTTLDGSGNYLQYVSGTALKQGQRAFDIKSE